MKLFLAFIVSLLASGLQGREVDIGVACRKLYESINILSERIPSDYAYEFKAGNTPYLNYTDGKFTLTLPIQIGQEGCNAEVTEKDDVVSISLDFSVIVTPKFIFEKESYTLKDLHINAVVNSTLRKPQDLSRSSSLKVVSVKTVYLEKDGKVKELTDETVARIRSTLEYVSAPKLKELSVMSPLVVGLFSSEMTSFSAILGMGDWALAEIAYGSGLIN